LYGAAAIAAGAAGRLVAGNIFNQTDSGGGTGGGTGGGSGSASNNSSQQTQTIIQNRNQAPAPIMIHLHAHTDAGVIVEKVLVDIGNNGRMREAIIKTANS
jgi:hypothetical protein